MNVLILGGTLFLGRHLVEAALARDHTITLFNRGTSGAHLFPHVEQLHGDRDGDLADWIVTMAERRQSGIYNATGPERPMTMREALEACTLAETIADTRRWLEASTGLPRPARLFSGVGTRAGLDAERERELLAAWHATPVTA